jgi:mono/diheme cytochrome c family protein
VSARGAAVAGALALALGGAGCGSSRADDRERADRPPAPRPPVTSAVEPPAPAPALDGAALMARFECNRCHEGTGLGAAPPEKQCVGCHREIRAGRFEAPAATLARWQRRIVSLPAVPSLTAIGARLRRDWVEAFLLQPTDLRPGLPATMPRLAITPAEAAAIARHLVPETAGSATPPGDAARGAILYGRFACSACHRLTGAEVGRAPGAPAVPAPTVTPDIVALAPDLAHTRDRFQPDRLAAWILDPLSVKPDTLMPRLGATASEAADLAAYILTTPLAPPTPVPPAARLPILRRRVTYAEVEARVFHFVCWHCHASPDYARGDGGPGNSGGFGFAERGLDLSTYAGIASGSLGDDGRRRSIFAPLPDGTPRLVAHLLARQSEERGAIVDGIRGMPLGLPALSPQQIQLVESWIAQGRPQ